MTFFVSGIPRTKGSWKPVRHRKTGKTLLVPSGRETVPWQESVAWAAKQEAMIKAREMSPSGVAVSLHLTYFLPRPEDHYDENGRLQEDAPPWPVTKGRYDLDKLERAIFDALTGIIYDDDSQVCHCDHMKRWADDSPPGVRVFVGEPKQERG